jgi:hypothetical protein
MPAAITVARPVASFSAAWPPLTTGTSVAPRGARRRTWPVTRPKNPTCSCRVPAFPVYSDLLRVEPALTPRPRRSTASAELPGPARATFGARPARVLPGPPGCEDFLYRFKPQDRKRWDAAVAKTRLMPLSTSTSVTSRKCSSSRPLACLPVSGSKKHFHRTVPVLACSDAPSSCIKAKDWMQPGCRCLVGETRRGACVLVNAVEKATGRSRSDRGGTRPGEKWGSQLRRRLRKHRLAPARDADRSVGEASTKAPSCHTPDVW